jgi:hypothetical protein
MQELSVCIYRVCINLFIQFLWLTTDGTDGGELTEEQKRRLAWLQEIGNKPKDLRISNLPYRGPPIA